MREPAELKLGVLWLSTDKFGRHYLTGQMENGTRVVVFRNRDKLREKQPDYVILQRRRTTKSEVEIAADDERQMTEIAADMLLAEEVEEMAYNNEKSDENQVGALWKKRSKKGFEFLSGKIDGIGYVVIFPNKFKQNPAQPDFRVLKSGDRDGQQQRNDAPPLDDGRVADTEGDEIPF